MRFNSKLKVALGIFGGLILLIFCLILLVHTPPARRFALEKVGEILKDREILFDATDLDYNLFNLTATLDNLVVRSARTPDLPPIIQAGKISVDLSLWDLISGKYTVESGAIQNPVIHIVVDEQGRDNLPRGPEEEETSEKTAYLIDQLAITNGSVRVEERRQKLDVSLPLWRLSMDGNPATNVHDIHFETGKPGQVAFEGRTLPIGSITADVDLMEDAVQVEALKLGLGESRVVVSGNLESFENPVYDAKVETNLQLAGLAEFAGLKQKVVGDLDLTLTAKGPLPKIEVTAVAQGENLTVEDFNRLNLAARAVYSAEAQRARVESLKVQSPAGTIGAQADVALAQEAGTSTVQANINSFDLLTVSRTLDLPVQVASRLNGTVSAQFPAMLYEQAQGRANLKFAATRDFPAKDVLPVSGAISAEAQGNRVTVNIDGLSALASEVNGRVALENRSRLDGQITAGIADLSAFPSRLNAFLGNEAVGMELGGTVNLKADLGGTLERPAAVAAVSAPDTRVGDLTGVALNVDAAYDPDQLTIQNASVQWREQGFTGAGTVGLKGKSPALDLTAKVPDADIATILAGLGQQDVPAKGTFSANAVVKGTTENPLADVSLSAKGMEAYGEQIGTLNVQALLENQVLTVPELRLVKPQPEGDGTLTANATYNLETEAYEVDAKAEELRLLNVTSPDGTPVRGEFGLTAQGRGTTENPSVDVSLTASGLEAYSEQIGTLTVQASLRDQVLTVPELRLVKPQPEGDGTLTANATYNLETQAYEVDAKAAELRLLNLTLPGGTPDGTQDKTQDGTPDGTPVRGEIGFTAQGKGTVEDPVLNLNLAVEDVQVREDSFGSVNAAVKLAEKKADFEVQAPLFALSASGQAGIEAPHPIEIKIQAENTDLANLPVRLPGVPAEKGQPAPEEPLNGTLSATVIGSGNLDNPELMDVTAQISELRVERAGQTIRTEGPLEARYSKQVVRVEPSTILAGESRIQIGGTIPVEKGSQVPADLRIEGTFDIANALQFAPDVDEQVNARGQLFLDFTLRGALNAITPEGTFRLENGYVSTPDFNPPIANLALNGQLNKGTVELAELRADWGVATIEASGRVPLDIIPGDLPIEVPPAQGPGEFNFALNRVNLATVQGVPDEVGGTISLLIEAKAEKPELEALQAKITFPDLSVTRGALQLQQQGTSTIEIENGTARVAQFQLTGTETQFQLGGTAQLAEPRNLDLKADGTLNAAILTTFVDDLRAEGSTRLEVAVRGTAQKPDVAGFVELSDANFGLADPRIAAEDLNLRINLEGDRVTLAQLAGNLNGGELTGGGSLRYADGRLQDVGLTINAKNVYLDVPANFRTVSNTDIKLQSVGDEVVLDGEVNVLEGSFKEDINLDQGLLSYLQSEPEVDLTEERSPILEKLRFDLDVNTQYPLVVENNLAEVAIGLDLEVVGTYYQPGLTGRINIEEGGELYFTEKTFLVDRGVITFTSDRRIEPFLDILARTQTGGYEITLAVQGSPDEMETTFTSDPPLPENDVIAVLLTGRTAEEIGGQETDIAREQVLSFLTGRVGGSLGRGIQQATGLSQVRIEPNLIAAESDPGARLTVGQDLSRKLSLIYSMDLVDSSDQIWIAEYDISKRFTTRGTKQSDNSYRFDFRHDIRFGGMAPPPQSAAEREKREIGKVAFQGNTLLTDKQLSERFKVKPGSRYDFFKVRKGLDRLNNYYAKQNLLESRIRMQREAQDSTVNLALNIEAGPQVQFVFEGLSVPGGLEKRIREIWKTGVFDAQRAEDAIQEIRSYLVKENYLQSKVEYSISTPEDNMKRVVFDIQPGIQFEEVELTFEGTEGIEAETLKGLIEEQKLEETVYTDPDEVSDLLSRYYREQGYLDAEIAEPLYQLDAQTRTGKVVIPVTEGSLYKVGTLQFSGNTVYDEPFLRKELPLKAGEPYRPALRAQSIRRLEDLYQEKGYNEMELEPTLQRSSSSGQIDVSFKIQEGKQSIVKDVEVAGTDHTSPSLVRSQLEVEPQKVLVLDELSRSRRNLYRTGAYSLVDVERREIENSRDVAANQKPVRLLVNVREIQPFELKYGAYFDTERGPGGIVDIANRNSLGSARVLGFRARYDSDLQEGRLYFSQPLLKRFPVRTIGTTFFRRENREAFRTDRIGISAQQEARIGKNYLFNYGYRLERAKTIDLEPDELLGPLAPIITRVAPLTATLTRETRDDILDATRGSFISNAVEYAPSLFGSQIRFVRYFGQFFKYIPLGEPVEIPFQSGVRKPRLVYAGGVRVGLAGGLGDQVLIPSERFFAGGGTSIRGFEQDGVGPQTESGAALGGGAVFITNHELRFPLFSIFDGVGFMDIGNLYPTISDFDITDLRKVAGFGVRVRTPYFLLRLDYGVKLDRRPDESFGRLFFSIGQAF
ncbi:MAG: translocation/assembly module TamB domain-containing protein [Bryobacteraceae bacterium]